MTTPARAEARDAEATARQQDAARSSSPSESGTRSGPTSVGRSVLALQRAAGNAAVARMLRSPQPTAQRLTVGGAVPRTLPDPSGPDVEEEIATGTPPEFLAGGEGPTPTPPAVDGNDGGDEGDEDADTGTSIAPAVPGAASEEDAASAVVPEAPMEPAQGLAQAPETVDARVPETVDVQAPETVDAQVPETVDVQVPETPGLGDAVLTSASAVGATPTAAPAAAVDEGVPWEAPVIAREIDLSVGTDSLPESSAPTTTPPTPSGDLSAGPTSIATPTAGGLLEAAATAALSRLTSTAASGTQRGASQAGAQARQAADAAGVAAGGAATAVTQQSETLRAQAQSGLPAVTRSGSTLLSGAVRSGFAGIRTMMQRLAGPIRARIQAWVQSGGRGDLAADLLGPVRSAVMGIVRSIQSTANRVVESVLGLVRRLTASMRRAVSSIARLARRVVHSVSRALRNVLRTVQRILGGVISTVMSVARSLGSVIASFVSRILSSVRAVIRRIQAAATGFVRRVTRAIVSFIQRVERAVVAGIRRLEAAITLLVRRLSALVQRLIRRVVDLVRRALQRLYDAIVRTIRRAAAALARMIMSFVLDWLKPRIDAALATARRLIERVRRYGQRYAEAAREGVRRTMALGRDLLQSLLKPEGDHFSIGLTGSLGASGGAYVAGTGAVDVSPIILDIHVSYRHLSFRGYLSVSGGLSGGVGVGGGGGVDAAVGGQVSWGSVLSYGREADMNASVGGWQVAGGVGAEVEAGVGPVGLSAGVGHQVSTNLGDIPQWAALAPFGVNPVTGLAPPPPGVPVVGGPGFPDTVPGTQMPRPPSGTWSGVGAGSPGPGREQYRPEPAQTASGSVYFETGEDTITPAHRTHIGGVAASAGRLADGADLATVRGRVVGHASPRWRYPRERRTAEQENQDLSNRRAAAANQVAESAIGAVSISAPYAISMDAPHGAGAGQGPADSDPRHQRRADVTYTVVRSTREVIPPPVNPHAPTPPPGQLPSLGWDTTASLAWTGKAGAEAHGAVKGSGSVSYTDPDPVWQENLGANEAKALRIVLGLYKVTLGVAVGDQMGLIRDAAGLVGGVEDLIGVELTDPIVDFVIPMPSDVDA